MTEQPTDEERRTWHRRFAIETNNRSWALVEKPELNERERQELLSTAYSSAHHWATIGTDRNQALADLLLSFVHFRLGHADLARSNAVRTLAYFEQTPGEPWERAFVHAAMAAAASLAGDRDGHAAHYATASEI